MRQGILFALVFATMALMLASTAGADAPRANCPNGFTA